MNQKLTELLSEIKSAVVALPPGGSPPAAGAGILTNAATSPMQDPGAQGGGMPPGGGMPQGGGMPPGGAGGGMPPGGAGGQPDMAMLESMLGDMGGEMAPGGETVTLPKDVFIHLIDSLSGVKSSINAEGETKKKKGESVENKLDTILNSLGVQMPQNQRQI